MLEHLKGKWALVTGASRGIGQQIAIALSRVGVNLILHARDAGNCDNTEALCSNESIQIHKIGASLDSKEGVQSLINSVKAIVDTPDIIYNNAGIQNEWIDTYSNGITVWMEQFQVNLFSVVQICNAFLPLMKEQKFGFVINTTSDIEGVPEMASYGAAKWAVRKLTSELAYDLKDSSVTINALDPGWLKTNLGGEDAPNSVESVIPGALAPLVEGVVKSGEVFSAQELREHKELKDILSF